MAADLTDLIAKVKKAQGITASATAFVQGVPARLQAAIDAAVANGATAEQLKPVQDEVDALNTSEDALAAALAANP